MKRMSRAATRPGRPRPAAKTPHIRILRIFERPEKACLTCRRPTHQRTQRNGRPKLNELILDTTRIGDVGVASLVA